MDFPAIDPVILDLGFLQLRWYGLMYVVGFVAGQWILTRLARRGFLPLPEERVGDLILWLVFGVLIGGRLGYATFYKQELWTSVDLFKVWEGGLSFHGGLLGVCVVFAVFARRHGLPVWRLGDCMALAVTPGIFCVRVANFINAELFGRTTTADVPWAMRFPTDPVAERLLGLDGKGMRDREQIIEMARAAERPEGYAGPMWADIRERIPLRHPSQIYEAIGEGLLLGLLLWFVFRKTRERPLGTGVYGGIFLAGYGGFRFLVEFFREPDAGMAGIDFGLSRGQTLSLSMLVAGLALIAWRWNKRLPAEAPAAVAGATGEANEA